jgi:signal transduction histidine kinase
VNDLEHAPFGAAWLRGLTPARLAVVLAVSLLIALPSGGARIDFQLGQYASGVWKIWDRFGRTFACAAPMLVLVLWVEARTARSPERMRLLALASAVLVGSLAYAALRVGLRNLHFTAPLDGHAGYVLVTHCSRAAITGGILTAILFFAARERDAQRLLHRTQLARVDIERQGVEARLQLLQAQIEPHFLFNSLASVKRLYEREPAQGRDLLRSLRECLRVATARAGRPDCSLGEEIALARSFLAIFQVRMGRRLRVSVDIPASLHEALIPTLMIGTLVENAIKHGIASRASGGTIEISARREEGHLVVDVRDDGVGFRARSGWGLGLANSRARLATLFGDAGDLDLRNNPAGGMTATIRVPFRMAAAGVP